MDTRDSAPSDATDIPLPNDPDSPDYIAAVASRVLMHIEQHPELITVPENVLLEATPHGLLMQAAPDSDHGRLILRLRTRLNRGLGARSSDNDDPGYVEVIENLGVVLGTSRRIPDITVVDWREHIKDRASNAITTAGVMLLVEVTSNDRREDLDQVDPTAKPRQYAAAGVPLYLVVDRKEAKILLFSDPVAGTYQAPSVYEVGDTVWLPRPLSFQLETEFMKALL